MTTKQPITEDPISLRIVELVNLGYSSHRIAAEVSLSQTAVRHRLKALGMKTLGKPVRVFKYRRKDSTGTGETEAACVVCATPLEGLQTKYCSRRCHVSTSVYSDNCYENQKQRARERKTELVRSFGGACSVCGYNKNLAALVFHHKDSREKGFSLDARKLASSSMKSIYEEASKCVLLCSNCHMEEHYPEHNLDIPS